MESRRLGYEQYTSRDALSLLALGPERYNKFGSLLFFKSPRWLTKARYSLSSEIAISYSWGTV